MTKNELVEDYVTALKIELLEEAERVGIPEHMQEGIISYICHGRRPGGFLEAVLCNNLAEAFDRASKENLEAMLAWVGFVFNHVPRMACRTAARVNAWVRFGGLAGGAAKKIMQAESKLLQDVTEEKEKVNADTD